MPRKRARLALLSFSAVKRAGFSREDVARYSVSIELWPLIPSRPRTASTRAPSTNCGTPSVVCRLVILKYPPMDSLTRAAAPSAAL